MSEWISIEQKLPEHSQYVYVKNKNERIAAAIFSRCKNDEPFWYFTHGIKSLKPTHWMPLPGAPQ